jgi:hypothetical protein
MVATNSQPLTFQSGPERVLLFAEPDFVGNVQLFIHGGSVKQPCLVSRMLYTLIGMQGGADILWSDLGFTCLSRLHPSKALARSRYVSRQVATRESCDKSQHSKLHAGQIISGLLQPVLKRRRFLCNTAADNEIA